MRPDAFAAAIESARAQRRAASLARTSDGYGISTPRYQLNRPHWREANTDAYARAYRSQVAVYACVQKRANGVAQAPLRVYREDAGDGEEQPQHPLRALLASPNPLVSEAEFFVYTVMQMDAVGFSAVEIERSAGGDVLGLWHLRPDWLRMIPRDNLPPQWQYKVPGRGPVTLEPEDVVIITGAPSLDLKPTGMSPIAVALREVDIDDSATDFLKVFLNTGGVPRYALTTEKTITDQAKADAIRERWSQVYGGYQNWSQVALLHSGLKVEEVGANIDGIAYPQLRALTETRICSAFGVPPILIGVQAGLDASTYSNYGQARRAFFEETVSPLWTRIAGTLGRALLPIYGVAGEYLAFDTSAVVALQEDVTARWDRAVKALAAGGITANQFQQAVGLPGFGDAGDVLYLPFSVQPTRPDDLPHLADEAARPPEPVPAPLAAAAEEDDPAPVAEDDKEEDRAVRIAAEGVDTGTLLVASESVATLPLETRARVVQTNRRNMTRIAAQFTPQLRTLFAAQGKEMAAAYRERDAALVLETRDLDDLLPLFAEHDEQMRGLLINLYQRAGSLSYKSASNLVGVDIPFDLSNPFVRRTQRDLARRIVGINETTRNDVRRVITDGIEAGLNHKQLADELEGLYAETYRGRSLTIARTESQVAYNLGTADAYKASGVVMAMILHDNPKHAEDYGALDGMSCAQRNGVITNVDAVQRHIYAEHPNGQLAASPLLVRPLGSP